MTTMLLGLVVAVFAFVALAWIALHMLLAFDWHEPTQRSTGPLWVPPVYRKRCQRIRQPRGRFDGPAHHAALLRAQWTPAATVITLPVGATFGQPVRSAA